MKLSDIASARKLLPPRLVVYGGPKVGKSTLAAGAPSPIFIPTEEGLTAIDVPAFPLASSFDQVLSAVVALAIEAHEFKTVVLDSLDWCESLILAHTSRLAGVASIEQVGGGYGKGFGAAVEHWRNLLDGMDYLRTQRGMTVILICHDEIRHMEPPDGDPFDMATLKLNKKATAVVTEWCDVLSYARAKRTVKKTDTGFGKEHGRAVGVGQRVLTLGQNPAYCTGNRYGLPDEVALNWAAFQAALDAARS